jgi:hypothetical protein
MPAAITPETTPTPAAATPLDLLGLETIDVVLRRHRGLRFCVRFVVIERIGRQQRRGLSLRDGLSGQADTRGKAEGDLQKMTAFHRDPS